MDIREIREQLGRVKAYYMRNDILRAVGAAVLGIKGVAAMTAPPSMEIRGLVREAVQLLSRDEQVKPHLKVPISYQPGQERQLLTQVASLYKTLLALQNREDRAVAFARKQKLDHSLNLGIKLLAQGQPSEADAAFAEAVNLYKNEHTLFRTISKALCSAGEVRRAMPYIKKGLEVMPSDTELAQLLEVAREKRAGS